MQPRPNRPQISNIEPRMGRIQNESTTTVHHLDNNSNTPQGSQKLQLRPNLPQLSNIEPRMVRMQNESTTPVHHLNNKSSTPEGSQKLQLRPNLPQLSNIEPNKGRIQFEPATIGFSNSSSWIPDDKTLKYPPIPPRHDSRRPFQASKPVSIVESQHNTTNITRIKQDKGARRIPTGDNSIAKTVRFTEVKTKNDCIRSERSHGKGPKATAEKVIQACNVTHLTLPKYIPQKILVSDLPEYFPGDDIGRNANRNEAYAEIRLKALKEHQHILVQLLVNLVNTDNTFRQKQYPGVNELAFNPQLVLEHLEGFTSTHHLKIPSQGSSCQAQWLQKHENAIIEYQRSIINLLHIDKNMCFWLNRYIRVMRRIRRSLDFMFSIQDDENMSIVSHNDTMTTASAAPTTSEPDSEESMGGISTPELERMGILMSKIPKYDARNNYRDSVESSILPSIDEDRRKITNTSNQTVFESAHSLEPWQFHSYYDSIPGVYYGPLPPVPNELNLTHFLDGMGLPLLPEPSTFILPPLQPFPTAPTAPLPPTPIPSPPKASNSIPKASVALSSDFILPPIPPPPTPCITTNITYHHDNLSRQSDHRLNENILNSIKENNTLMKNRPGQSPLKEHPCFQEIDDLETSVFVGIHMHNLQKSKEILSKFNKESALSGPALERFKVAKEEYDSLAMPKYMI
ncbi:hypothetical protein BGZ76_011207 [Entomortierella beljakovae]|nr:hypothetical protein BGZ76_011207 [Entomortierella beljakovae]